MTAQFVVQMNPRKDRVYLSGPMSGVPNLNRVMFDHAAEEVYFGWEAEPINPHLLHEGETDTSWRGFMIRDVSHLLQANRIYMLRGWWWSKVARWEWLIARFLMRLPVTYQGGVLGGLWR